MGWGLRWGGAYDGDGTRLGWGLRWGKLSANVARARRLTGEVGEFLQDTQRDNPYLVAMNQTIQPSMSHLLLEKNTHT